MSRADQLEQVAEIHRGQLMERISALTASVTPEAQAKQTDVQTPDLGRTLVKALFDGAGQSPSGLALIGIGAAALALNSGHGSRPGHGNNADDRITPAEQPTTPCPQAQTGCFAAQQSASHLRTSLDKGLDRLPQDARARVIEARLRAIDAQEKLDVQARQTREAHVRQPLLTAAIAAGIGAVIGALIPATKAETDRMVATRDKRMRDAEALLHAELAILDHPGKTEVVSGPSKVGDDASRTTRTADACRHRSFTNEGMT